MLGKQKWILLWVHGLFVLALLAFTFSCNQAVPIEPPNSEEAAITASIDLSHTQLTASAITDILLQVSGAGMDTVRKHLTLDGTKATAQLKVKAGKSRTFTATAYQGATTVLSGSSTMDLAAGKSANVAIRLNFLISAIMLSPPDTSVAKDASFTLYIKARNVTDLCTFGAKISFDKTKLEVLDLGREDTFLKSNGGAINQLRFTKDNTLGKVEMVLGVFPATTSVTGDGKIGKIVFKALAAGTANLTISMDTAADADLGLYDKNANLVNSLALGGQITIR